MTTIPLKLPLPGNIFTIPVTPLRKEKNVIVLGPLPESQTQAQKNTEMTIKCG
ncbi:unnamed protein product, partial [Hymenolepis diminuta]